jgi:NhaP-type Na+/H+ or K+/H+ antiporter
VLASAFRRLAAIGAGVGLGMSIATGYLLRWLRWRGARASIEFTIVLAVSYLSFYVANSPAMVRLQALYHCG